MAYCRDSHLTVAFLRVEMSSQEESDSLYIAQHHHCWEKKFVVSMEGALPPADKACSERCATRESASHQKGDNQLNTITQWSMALATLLGSLVANAQSITFDFTGRVADATYPNPSTAVIIPDGTLVTGSFTFSYDPLMSGAGSVSGTIGTSSPQGWLATMPGVGPGYSLFSDTVQVVGFSTSYSSGNTGVGSSQIGGGSTTGLPTNPCGGFSGFSQPSGSLNGCEMSGSGSVGTDSWIILAPKPGTVDFLSNGLPNISNIQFGSGEFVYYTHGPTSDIFAASGVQYEIDSITRAPEIDSISAASGLTLLLGTLVVLRGRRAKSSAVGIGT